MIAARPDVGKGAPSRESATAAHRTGLAALAAVRGALGRGHSMRANVRCPKAGRGAILSGRARTTNSPSNGSAARSHRAGPRAGRLRTKTETETEKKNGLAVPRQLPERLARRRHVDDRGQDPALRRVRFPVRHRAALRGTGTGTEKPDGHRAGGAVPLACRAGHRRRVPRRGTGEFVRFHRAPAERGARRGVRALPDGAHRGSQLQAPPAVRDGLGRRQHADARADRDGGHPDEGQRLRRIACPPAAARHGRPACALPALRSGNADRELRAQFGARAHCGPQHGRPLRTARRDREIGDGRLGRRRSRSGGAGAGIRRRRAAARGGEAVCRALRRHRPSKIGEYGFEIEALLLEQPRIPHEIVDASNRVTAAIKLKEAATFEGDAHKIGVVKRAEADKDAKKLSGEGVAAQAKAIADGRLEIVKALKDEAHLEPASILAMQLMTQFFDTMREIGKSPSATIMLPGSIGGAGDYIRDGMASIMAALVAARPPKTEPSPAAAVPAAPAASAATAAGASRVDGRGRQRMTGLEAICASCARRRRPRRCSSPFGRRRRTVRAAPAGASGPWPERSLPGALGVFWVLMLLPYGAVPSAGAAVFWSLASVGFADLARSPGDARGPEGSRSACRRRLPLVGHDRRDAGTAEPVHGRRARRDGRACAVVRGAQLQMQNS